MHVRVQAFRFRGRLLIAQPAAQLTYLSSKGEDGREEDALCLRMCSAPAVAGGLCNVQIARAFTSEELADTAGAFRREIGRGSSPGIMKL